MQKNMNKQLSDRIEYLNQVTSKKNTLNHLLSWKDPKSTAKYALSLNLIMFTAWLLGDSLSLMLVFNICILYPLAYKKKKANLDSLSLSFDSILDKYLRLIPFVS